MLTIPAIFVTSFLIALTGALMPGPLLTFAIGESARRGYVAGPLIVAGHAILELALVFSIAFGLFSFAGKDWLIDLLSVAGGVIIVFMGITSVRDSRTATFDPSPGSLREAGRGFRHPVVGGIIISAANPYWTLWWVGVVAAYFKQVSAYGAAGYAAFFAGHILADLGWYTLVAVIVATGRRWLDQAFYRRLIIVSGLFLVALGLFFVFFGVT